MSRDCFISYRSTDRELAERVHDGLVSAGLDPDKIFLDRKRLIAGDRWDELIEKECDSSRVILPVLTPRWQSQWTLFETYGAEAVIPLLFEGQFDQVAPPTLRRFQAEKINFADGVSDADWKQLADAIRRRVATEPPRKITRFDVLPYQTNPDFKGRAAVLIEIHEKLHDEPTTDRNRGRRPVVLAGMGGVGKTTLARQYAEKFWRCYQQILWVDGRNPGGLDAEYAALFETVFPGRGSAEIAESDKAELVRQELDSDEERLLIIDNAEDAASAERKIPSAGGCYTLVTSRLTGWPRGIQSVTVRELDPAAAREFLSSRTELPLSDPAEERARDELARTLGDLPLALEQAAAYILQQGMDFRGYLDLYQEAAADLLSEGVRGSTEYPDSVFVTWKATVDKLSPASRALLRTAAFMAEVPIPVQLLVDGDETLRRGTGLMTESGLPVTGRGPNAQNPEIFVRRVLGELASYSMVQLQSVRLGGKVLNVASIHALVQTVERAGLSPGDQAHWTLAAASFVHACPEDPTDPREWPFLRLATGHLSAAAVHGFPLLREETLTDSRGHRLSHAELAEAIVALFEYCARFDHALERIDLAEQRLRLALALDQRLPRNSRRTVRLLQSTGSLLADAGRLAEAEPLARRALDLYEEELGSEHPEVAEALSRLAAVVGGLGRWNEAESQLLRAVRLLDAHADSPQWRAPRRDLFAQLGALYASADRDAEAERAFTRVRELDEQLAGSSADELVARRSLLIEAWRASAEGRDADAERLVREFVEANRPERGAGVHDLPFALGQAAAVLQKLRRFDLAEQCLMDKLALDESDYTAEHPQFAQALEDLAELYIEMDRESDAEPRLRQALAILDRAYPRGHPRVANVLAQLGRSLSRTDRLEEAQPLLQRAITVYASTPGAPALTLAGYQSSLAQVLIRAGKPAEAKPLMDHVLETYERQYGPASVQLADCLGSWAASLAIAGETAGAEQLARRALAIKEAAMGPDSPDLLRELDCLGAVINPWERPAEAEDIARRALAICEKSLGADHPKAMSWRDWLWQFLAQKGDAADAAHLLKISLELRDRAPAPNDREVAEACVYLAELLWSAGAGPDGEPYARRATHDLLVLSAREERRHPMLARATYVWGACLHATGKTPDQIAAARRALFAELGLEQLLPEVLAEIWASAQSETMH